jgi:hypothetical protein
VVLEEVGHDVLLRQAHLEGGPVELLGGVVWQSYIERSHMLISG